MSATTTNRAAWQKAPGEPLQVGAAPLPQPGTNEILIRNAAIAINPIDWLLQDNAILPWLDYPTILGSDVAGEIVAIGHGVTRLKVGDRVLGQAVGTTVNKADHGAFQEHTIVLEHMASPIPDQMTFVEAAVLPLGLGTAASGLYGSTQLALRPPTSAAVSSAEVVLVWGGSSSVGCNAIQLAVASGYRCITVASERNADMLKKLGATEVFDYKSDTLVDDLVNRLSGQHLAGTLHATGDIAACMTVVSRCEGVRKIAATLPPPEDRPASVDATHIFGTMLKDDDVGPMIYREFLPKGLADGTFVAAPPARISGSGLEALQAALEAQKAGVTATKIVVTLP